MWECSTCIDSDGNTDMSKANCLLTTAEFQGGDLLEEIGRLTASILSAGGLSADELNSYVTGVASGISGSERSVRSINLGSRQRDCMEVMCVWRREPAFLSDVGLPAALKIKGPGASFQALCLRAGVQASYDELLTILQKFGAIHIDENDQVSPCTPTFLLGASDHDQVVALDGVLRQVAGFLRVVEHNLLASSRGRNRRFERTCTVQVRRDLVPVFERVVSERGQDFIDSVDEWLERHRESDAKDGPRIEIGVGAYFVDLGCAD